MGFFVAVHAKGRYRNEKRIEKLDLESEGRVHVR